MEQGPRGGGSQHPGAGDDGGEQPPPAASAAAALPPVQWPHQLPAHHQQQQQQQQQLEQQQAAAMSVLGGVSLMMQQPPSHPLVVGNSSDLLVPAFAAAVAQHQLQLQLQQQHHAYVQRPVGLGAGGGASSPRQQQYPAGAVGSVPAGVVGGWPLPPGPLPLPLPAYGYPPLAQPSQQAQQFPQLLPQLSIPQAPIPLPPGGLGAMPAHVPPAPVPPGAACYLPLDPSYPGLRLLHVHPPMYAVADFLSPQECDALMASADGFLIRAPVVGAGNGELSGSRTSSTCYFAREDVPTVIAKVCRLTGKPPEHVELPQVGRYLASQEYKQHFDAFDLGTEDGRRFAENGGQRVATVLIYLNDVGVGGKTIFPRLHLSVTPTKGMALVFFPATLDGRLDEWALHAAEPAVENKWVSQVWVRQGCYAGVPTRRIATI